MTSLVPVALTAALAWDVRSRWRAERELRGMSWPNWMAATDRADALKLVVGPLVVNVLLIGCFVSAATGGTGGGAPGLGAAVLALLVFAGVLAVGRGSLWLTAWAAGFWYATSSF